MEKLTLRPINQDETIPENPLQGSTVRIYPFHVTTKQLEELLSVTQFSDEAGVSPQAVRKMISEDRIHAQKLGEQYVISREELNRYLADK